MEKEEFKERADLILSYLRVGSDLKTAFDAVEFEEKDRSKFLKQYDAKIKQAQATCRIVCLHNIMTEGGQSGSRYILDELGKQDATEEKPTKRLAENKVDPSSDFDFDFNF